MPICLKSTKGVCPCAQNNTQNQVSPCTSAFPWVPSASTPKTAPCLCSFSPLQAKHPVCEKQPLQCQILLGSPLVHLHPSDLHPRRLVLSKPPVLIPLLSRGQAAGWDRTATPCLSPRVRFISGPFLQSPALEEENNPAAESSVESPVASSPLSDSGSTPSTGARLSLGGGLVF